MLKPIDWTGIRAIHERAKEDRAVSNVEDYRRRRDAMTPEEHSIQIYMEMSENGFSRVPRYRLEEWLRALRDARKSALEEAAAMFDNSGERIHAETVARCIRNLKEQE